MIDDKLDAQATQLEIQAIQVLYPIQTDFVDLGIGAPLRWARVTDHNYSYSVQYGDG